MRLDETKSCLPLTIILPRPLNFEIQLLDAVTIWTAVLQKTLSETVRRYVYRFEDTAVNKHRLWYTRAGMLRRNTKARVRIYRRIIRVSKNRAPYSTRVLCARHSDDGYGRGCGGTNPFMNSTYTQVGVPMEALRRFYSSPPRHRRRRPLSALTRRHLCVCVLACEFVWQTRFILSEIASAKTFIPRVRFRSFFHYLISARPRLALSVVKSRLLYIICYII